jgi:hypothetical protein
MSEICGHTTTSGIGTTLFCGKKKGHEGYHEQGMKLRRSDGSPYTEYTNWLDNGKAIWTQYGEGKQ